MKKETPLRTYTTEELRAKQTESRTDLSKIDAMTDEELERLIAEDEDEKDLRPDWTKAEAVRP